MLDSQTLDQHEVLGKCRALLSQFRALVGATVTDETLLTYLVKNKGDIVAATQVCMALGMFTCRETKTMHRKNWLYSKIFPQIFFF